MHAACVWFADELAAFFSSEGAYDCRDCLEKRERAEGWFNFVPVDPAEVDRLIAADTEWLKRNAPTSSEGTVMDER
jgi:hypothetical protein